MHAHPASVVIALTSADVRFTLPDGTTQDAHFEAGQVVLGPGHEHLPENLSDQPFEILQIEFKDA